MNRIFTFFKEGVGGAVQSLLSTRPGHAGIIAINYFSIDKNISVVLYRTISHELAHALEAKVRGAEVETIEITLDIAGFSGETTIDRTTPTSARLISLAGITSDLGFLFVSTNILKRITPGAGIVFLLWDAVAFFGGQDFQILSEANKHIKMERKQWEA